MAPTTRKGPRIVVDVSGLVRARVAVDPAVLSVDPVEFVWPNAKDPRWEAQTDASLYPAATGGAPRALLAELAQVQVREDPGAELRVRTYGELEIDGFVSKQQFEPAAGPPVSPRRRPASARPTRRWSIRPCSRTGRAKSG